MKITNTLHVTDRSEWRSWLEKNHESATEVWLPYDRRHTGRPRIPYEDAVEEALCFGWIDSIVKRIDDERYAQKFTPRKNASSWSELNKRRARRLIAEGRMTEAGLAKCRSATAAGGSAPRPRPKRAEPAIPAFVERALKAKGKAWENFNNLAPSYRRNYIGWITA
ncbi:MAG: hypothetical protein FJW35_10360, partial [Acidobacteria bacterium]|nr:hypothetical protein [Acidobacteriota bacterium]